MDETKYQIWIAATLIIFAIFIATGHWFLAILSLVASYIIWNIKQ